MYDSTPGTQIRTARQKKQWTQAQLARHLDLSAARLCHLEKDHRHPSPQEWARLRTCLALGAYPQTLELPTAHPKWRAYVPFAAEPQSSVWSRRQAARKTFGPLVDTLAARAQRRHKTASTFLRYARLESGDEYLFWLRLLVEGGQPCCYSPARAGFRTWSVLDPKSKRQVGDLRAPCLELSEQKWLLFPQLTLDTRKSIYRLDALLCLRRADGRFWFNVEVDGFGHDPRCDRQRQAPLALPTVRITSTDLTNKELVPIIASKLALHLPALDSLAA